MTNASRDTQGRLLMYRVTANEYFCPGCADRNGLDNLPPVPLNHDEALTCEQCERLFCWDDDATSQSDVSPRYDVRATCWEIGTKRADGAYSLIGDNLTPEQVCEALLQTLRDGFGLTNAGPCRLSVHIGPRGSGEVLPM